MANEMKIFGIFVVLGILIVGCFIVNIIDKSVRLENGRIVDKILIPKHHEEAIINSRRTFVPDRFYLILDGVVMVKGMYNSLKSARKCTKIIPLEK